MIKTKTFGNFSADERVIVEYVGLLRRKVYIEGLVKGVRHNRGREYLVIETMDGNLIDVSAESAFVSKASGAMTVPDFSEDRTDYGDQKPKYNRV